MTRWLSHMSRYTVTVLVEKSKCLLLITNKAVSISKHFQVDVADSLGRCSRQKRWQDALLLCNSTLEHYLLQEISYWIEVECLKYCAMQTFTSQ